MVYCGRQIKLSFLVQFADNNIVTLFTEPMIYPTGINNHILCKVWCEITSTFLYLNGSTTFLSMHSTPDVTFLVRLNKETGAVLNSYYTLLILYWFFRILQLNVDIKNPEKSLWTCGDY